MYFLYYFVAGLPWLHGQGGFQEGERFVPANISKDAHIYLHECTSRCRANIEYMEPVVVLDGPIIYFHVTLKLKSRGFRVKSSLGFFLSSENDILNK